MQGRATCCISTHCEHKQLVFPLVQRIHPAVCRQAHCLQSECAKLKHTGQGARPERRSGAHRIAPVCSRASVPLSSWCCCAPVFLPITHGGRLRCLFRRSWSRACVLARQPLAWLVYWWRSLCLPLEALLRFLCRCWLLSSLARWLPGPPSLQPVQHVVNCESIAPCQGWVQPRHLAQTLLSMMQN